MTQTTLLSDETETTKRCTGCGELKPLDDFHRDRKGRKGRVNNCKPCAKERWHRWYGKNAEMHGANAAAWVKTNPERARATAQAWSSANRERVNENGRRARERHPEKERARRKVNNDIRDGRLIKPKHCTSCGEEVESRLLQGHHYRGYEPEHWLDIRWLCIRCHTEEHASDAHRRRT